MPDSSAKPFCVLGPPALVAASGAGPVHGMTVAGPHFIIGLAFLVQ